MADTTNYGWTKPTVGGSDSTWGTLLNAALDDIDADLKTVANGTTAAQILTKLLTVDGSGSGIDADLLDGLQGSKFLKHGGTENSGTITIGTGDPTGGSDGDVHFKVSA